MLIIWGVKTTAHVLGVFTMVCSRCGNPAAHRVEKLVRKFTLFWIPLFPVGQRHLLTCAFCGVTQEVPKDQVPGLMNALQTQGTPYPAPPQPGVPPQGMPPRGMPPHYGTPYPGQGDGRTPGHPY